MERFTEQETIDDGSIITHPNNCGVMTHAVCEKDIFWKIVNKLKEYEDLEEQGKIIKFPCVVGDKLYRPWTVGSRKVIAIFTVNDFRLIDNEWFVLVSSKKGLYIRQWKICDFNKIFFADMEIALKKMQEVENE